MPKKNSNPNAQLISISKEVLAILQDCLDGSESPLVTRFQAAIAAAEAKKPKHVCILCGDPIIDETIDNGFLGKHLKPASAHFRCADMSRRNAQDFAEWCDRKRELEYQAGRKFDKNAMSICACGHGSLAHEADELDNLLQCEACECDHFHYDSDDSDDAISLEASSMVEESANA